MEWRKFVPQAAYDSLKSCYRRRGLLYFIYRSWWDREYFWLSSHSSYWYLWAALTGKPLVHFIGDSHTKPFNFQPRFIVHHIGQPTAHNLVKQGSSSDSEQQLSLILSKINLKRDFAVLVFGEIDCRVHFYYQYIKNKKKISLSALIGKTIENYGQAMRDISNKGVRFAILGIAPAGKQKNIYDYPSYGSPSIRAKISSEFNARLSSFCRKNGYPFIDIYSQAADSRGFLKQKLARDEIHLNKTIVPYVRQKLNAIFKLDL